MDTSLCQQMCKMVEETTQELVVHTSVANQTSCLDSRKNRLPIETICEDINRILYPAKENPQTSKAQPDRATSDQQSKNSVAVAPESQSSPPQAQEDNSKPAASASEVGSKEESVTELKPDKEISKLMEKAGTRTGTNQIKEKTTEGSLCDAVPAEDPQTVTKRSESDVVVEERKGDPPVGNNGSAEKTKQGVIVLDD